MATFRAAGLDDDLPTAPRADASLEQDAARFRPYWERVDGLLARLGGPRSGDAARRAAVLELRRLGAESRMAFLDRHAATIYRRLTGDLTRFERIEALMAAAPNLVPGLAPTEAALAEEAKLKQGEKPGLEIQQGLLLSSFLALPEEGHHLCHAMLLPRAESAEALARFRREGRLDLGRALLERRGPAGIVTLNQPERLNCEDDSTTAPLEIAVDVALLDPEIRIGVLRGAATTHPKYAGRRLFGSGINLTGLYHGQVSYFFYVIRDIGFINKMFRGLARPDRDPSEVGGGTAEKLWIALCEGFAIGGACQILLAVDHVIAERDAYLTLPARKEGIIPGMANLRLPRFVGDRIARQAVMNDLRIECNSDIGRMICTEVVERSEIERALDRTIESLTSSGVVSAESNRRAFRVGMESFDTFRQYAAVYAREQAFCHLSPALIDNLERHWQAHQRKRV